MAAGNDSLWLVVPAGETAAGGWIDDTLRERVVEKDLLGRTPLAGRFPRQRVEVVSGPDAARRAAGLYQARGWTDGFPVILPTAGRVREMLAFTERKATEVLGEVEPLKGLATIEKIAANAVMAGCRADYFPVVLATVEAVLDPAFNLRGLQTTDENAAPLIVVNGPIAKALDINGSLGAHCASCSTTLAAAGLARCRLQASVMPVAIRCASPRTRRRARGRRCMCKRGTHQRRARSRCCARRRRSMSPVAWRRSRA
jgi:hypothetical protein